jgi:hypothetical protein
MLPAVFTVGRPSVPAALASGVVGCTRRAAGVAALVCLAVLATAQVSAAQLIVARGGAIYAMNDDGSNQRQLIAASQIPGVAAPAHLSDVDVFQNGGQTLAFTYGGSVFSPGCGLYCEAIYTLSSGSLTRLSPAGMAFDGTWVSYDAQPRVTADSEVAYQSTLWDLDTSPSTLLATYPVSGGGASQGWASDGASVGLPTPNPANAAELAWVSWLNNRWEMHITNRSDSSDVLVAYSYGQDQPTSMSWSADGTRLLVSYPNEIVELNPATGSQIRLYSYTGSSGGPTSVRFMGSSSVVFVQNGNVYSIPATCNDCTSTNATQLTSGGDSYSVAWTSATTPIPALAQTPGTGSQSGTGNNGAAGGGATTAPRADCVVPTLSGKSVAAARSMLHHADCAIGTVRTPTKPQHKPGTTWVLVVGRQSPAAGAIRQAGTRLNLTLIYKAKRSHR